MDRLKRVIPYWPYGLLSLVALGPLLLPGYVLTMDMVFTPDLRMPSHVDNTWLLYASLHVLDILLPADVVQKLLLLCILLLSSIGAHRLLMLVRPQQEGWRTAVYVGAIFYVVNPFVYDRLMAGQWGVLLGYSLLPWFTASLVRLGRDPTWRRLCWLVGWTTLLGIVSIHSLGAVAVLVAVAFALQAADKSKRARLLRFAGVGIACFILLNSYWLLPAVMGQGRIAQSLQTFSNTGSTAFGTVDAVGTGTLGSILGLLGFWQEKRGLYVQPIEAYALWGLVYLVIIVLMIWGAWLAWKHQRMVAVGALCVSVISVLLALGIGHAWLVSHVPFFAGFREPQKFVALLALAYCYFMTWAAAWFMTRWKGWRRAVIVAVLFMLPFLYAPSFIWGAAGQLHATDYPKDWFAVNDRLNAQSPDGKALVLPWHLYMSYSFTNGRIIASPTPAFFDREVITSDDPELPGVKPQTRNTIRETVQHDILPALKSGQSVADVLSRLGIRYIIVSKDLDWREYSLKPDEVTRLYDGEVLSLYRLAK